jgi:hypothetical protein
MKEYDGRKENVWVEYTNYDLSEEKKKRTSTKDKIFDDTERNYSDQWIYISFD